MRFTPAVFPCFRVLVLVPLQAVRVERAGLNLAVPRGPQRVRQLNERRNVRSPPAGDGWVGVHVERSVDNVPCVARVRRRAELVFVEDCGSNRAGRDLGQPPCEQGRSL